MATTLAEVDAGDSLRSVAQELTADEIGAVLVEAGGGTVGLISERDLVTVLATGGDIDTAQAADIMTGDLGPGSCRKCIPQNAYAEPGRVISDSARNRVRSARSRPDFLIMGRDTAPAATLAPDGSCRAGLRTTHRRRRAADPVPRASRSGRR